MLNQAIPRPYDGCNYIWQRSMRKVWMNQRNHNFNCSKKNRCSKNETTKYHKSRKKFLMNYQKYNNFWEQVSLSLGFFSGGVVNGFLKSSSGFWYQRDIRWKVPWLKNLRLKCWKNVRNKVSSWIVRVSVHQSVSNKNL